MPNALDKIGGQAWLGHKCNAAGSLGLLLEVIAVARAQYDDRNAGRPAVAFEVTRDLPAVHQWHRQIHQDQVGHDVANTQQRLDTISRLDDVEPGVLQGHAVHLASGGLPVGAQTLTEASAAANHAARIETSRLAETLEEKYSEIVSLS